MKKECLAIKGNLVKFEIPVNMRYDYMEMQIVSDRNKPFTRLSDISQDHPNPAQEKKRNDSYDHDMIFPIVDIKPEIGMKLRFDFKVATGEFCFNTGYNKKLSPIKGVVEIESGEFMRWENDMYLADKTTLPTKMAIVRKIYPVAGKAVAGFETLSPYFTGDVSFVGFVGGAKETLYETRVEINSHGWQPAGIAYLPIDLPPDVAIVKKSVAEALGFLRNAQNKSTDELTGGGMYLFYDLDEKCYRANHWNWTWGPAMKFLLDAAKLGEFGNPQELTEYAVSMADCVLRFQHPVTEDVLLSGVGLGRWQNDLMHPNCTMGYYSIADSGFCAKWGLSQVYAKTKDSKYLDSMLALYDTAITWVDKFGVIPSDFQDDINCFLDRTLNETMFGMGLFTELFKLTGDEKYKNQGIRYFDALVSALYLGEGVWARIYLQEEKKNLGFNNDSKGHGWAMDGLLCANELAPENPSYLEKAKKTADFIMQYQHSDGHFNNFFAQEESGGVGEKSTGLWSWLLYRLYAETHEEKYVAAARKALIYMINSMDDGQEDPNLRGGVIANSHQSGIIYRPYFKMACTYATSFFGLAALEELKLH